MSTPAAPAAAASGGAAAISASDRHAALRQAVLVYAAAFAAGALLTCAFAPLGVWPLAILCPALLMWLWEGATPRRAAWSGFCFGAGTFAFGTPLSVLNT